MAGANLADAKGAASGGSANVFDAAGDRLAHTDDVGKATQKTTSYLVDTDTSYSQVIEERAPDVSDAAGGPALQARYVWGGGLAPLAMWRKMPDGSVKLFFHLSDGQNSVRQLTDAAGAVVDAYFYDAWGNTLDGSSNHVANPFRYTGQQRDADGKYFLRARFYSPGTGRFLSHDPLMGQLQDATSLHRYLYAGADSANNSDPSGLTTIAEVSLVSAQIGEERLGQAQALGRFGQARALLSAGSIVGGTTGGSGVSIPFIDPYYAYLGTGSVQALAQGSQTDRLINARERAEEEDEEDEDNNEQNIVYRALQPGEAVSVALGLGIQRLPGSISLAEHISGHFIRNEPSVWVSTTRRLDRAVSFASGGNRPKPLGQWSRIIRIDLNKLSYPYFDCSTLEGFVGSINIKGGWSRVDISDRVQTSINAVFQREVSVEGGINPGAIVGYEPVGIVPPFGFPPIP